ncbi:endolytic transglycosylase MltG [Candidatus Saccharibacteria bacterium]|nr:endolytic transglycosylase MltG [Candidatus Saccharibacteria bacterium]
MDKPKPRPLKPEPPASKPSTPKTPISKQRTIRRRPSVEIAKSYVELNLKNVIDSEKTAKLSKKQKKQIRTAEKKAERLRHRVRNAFLIAIAVILLAVGSTAIWWQTSIQPVNTDDTSERQFEVAAGASTDQIATGLQKAKFIRNALAFKIYVRLHGTVIQAGSHMLSPSDSLSEVAEKLTQAVTAEIDVQIPPGQTLGQLRDVFKKYGYTDAQIDVALSRPYDNDILNDKPADASLEGYIFPDTYRIYADDKLDVVIEKALNQLSKVAAENDLRAKYAARGFTFYEGLTLASIIEKEVVSDSDRRNVAQVFLNRLAIGMPLGADATFKYAYKRGLCDYDSPSLCASIYNTRIYGGLPPGPISNAVLSALNAVANPEPNDYFFYVSGDDGRTHFSRTEEQHNAAVAEYCTEACR